MPGIFAGDSVMLQNNVVAVLGRQYRYSRDLTRHLDELFGQQQLGPHTNKHSFLESSAYSDTQCDASQEVAVVS